MKMYAELVGNYKKFGIKSPNGNKLNGFWKSIVETDQ